MFRELLRKRLLKVIPIWLLSLLALVSFAAAGYTMISNQVHTQVTVSNVPITITGNFNTQAYVDQLCTSTFTYTVSGSAPTGYIQIMLSGTFSALSDAQISVNVNPTSGEGGTLANAAAPYYGSNQIILLLGGPTSTTSTPIPIEFGSVGGTIQVFITYTNTATIGTVESYMQVTSTLN